MKTDHPGAIAGRDCGILLDTGDSISIQIEQIPVVRGVATGLKQEGRCEYRKAHNEKQDGRDDLSEQTHVDPPRRFSLFQFLDLNTPEPDFAAVILDTDPALFRQL